MKIRRLSAALAIAALALCVYTMPAHAQAQKYKGASSGLGDPTLITVSGQVLFRIRAGAGGYTATQRAEAVQDRLVPILSLEHLNVRATSRSSRRAPIRTPAFMSATNCS